MAKGEQARCEACQMMVAVAPSGKLKPHTLPGERRQCGGEREPPPATLANLDES